MGENSRQQVELMSKEESAKVPPPLRRKVDLLLHLLRNSRNPIGLVGSQEDQVAVFNALQKEERFLHSAYRIQADQEAGLPYVFGLLFHLLSISEQEVAGADPEQLLTRHLAALGKNSQFLLLFICPENELGSDSRKQLVGLAERHPALRLIFALDDQNGRFERNEGLCLFSLLGQEASLVKQAGKPFSSIEIKRFRLIGMAVAVLLAGILLAAIGFPPEMGGQARVEQLSQVEPEAVGEIEEVKVLEPSSVSLAKKLLEKPSQIDTSDPVAPVLPIKKEVVQVASELQKKIPVQKVEKPKPFDAIEVDESKDANDEIKEAQAELVVLQKELSPVDLTTQDEERASVPVPAVVPPKSREAAVKDKSSTEASHQEKWLLAQPKGNFTLQIMGGSEQDLIANYVKAQKNRELFAYYRTVKRGKNWYPLLYGIYSSKESAKEAISGLPQSLQKLQPWARSLESIQMEIHKAAGSNTRR